jgi:hypothetical protein
MAVSPSTENYTLGKGVVFFDQKDLATGMFTGERDLGNAPEFAFNVALEKLEHFSSRGGLKAKDKEIISQITPGVTFTLDEINVANMALLTLADVDTVTQVAGDAQAEVVTAHVGKRSDLSFRNVGLTTLSHGTVTTGPFVEGEVVTGATSSATGTVISVGLDFVQVVVSSGVFETGEEISGDTSLATANLNADPAFVSGVLLVQDDADLITYVKGVDYDLSTILRDDKIGRILILDGSTIPDGAEIHVTYGYEAASYTEIKAFNNTQIEGQLRFVSDNPAGTQQELEIWRCSLTPTGDTAMIGDDWSTLGFTGEILKDELGHPDSPYMTIRMA